MERIERAWLPSQGRRCPLPSTWSTCGVQGSAINLAAGNQAVDLFQPRAERPGPPRQVPGLVDRGPEQRGGRGPRPHRRHGADGMGKTSPWVMHLLRATMPRAWSI